MNYGAKILKKMYSSEAPYFNLIPAFVFINDNLLMSIYFSVYLRLNKTINSNSLFDLLMNLQPIDIETLKTRGITEEKLEEELRQLREGFPFLEVVAPATAGNGIMETSMQQRLHYIGVWNNFLADGGKVVKMVPASGAASRMFKNLFAFADGDSETPDNEFIKTFCDSIEKFSFYKELDETVKRIYGKSIMQMFEEGKHREVVAALIKPEGMNYGQLPKALLAFHSSEDGYRVALEEHLAEGAQYASGPDKLASIHFTVSPDHRGLMTEKIEKSIPKMKEKYGVDFNVTLSEQKPSTDTVAANPDGTPYREDGKLFFRPGGHGALIENLNDLEADVVFLKNIDNVVPDALRDSTIEYKKVIGGILVSVQEQIMQYAEMLTAGLPSREELKEILDFVRHILCVTEDKADAMEDLEVADYLYCKLNRPLRVCGMVRNEGEPGGGPFLVRNAVDGTVAPQILESTQINPEDAEAVALMKNSTHFNPVDLAVCLKSPEGGRFDLRDYVDASTGFISSKSRKGHEIKALELPGLWNGAMSDWNTIFVEVPADTFNPVKTVNDLLRPAHQG